MRAVWLALFLALASWAAEPVVGFADVNGARLQYVDWGGSGPALILLPGGCDTAFVFGDLAPLLRKKHRVVGLTPRGCGDSARTPNRYSMADQTADMAGFMDAMGFRTASWAGHSSGSGKITRFAERFGDRVEKLVYLDPVYRFVADGLEEKLDAAVVRRAGGDSLSSPRHWERNFRLWELGAWSAAMVKERAALTATQADGTLRRRNSDAEGWLEQTTADMRNGAYFATRINGEALLLFAMNTDRDRARALRLTDLDSAVGSTERARQEEIAQFRLENPRARIVLLPHTAHYLFVQRPRRVAAEMLRFLQ